MNTPIEYTGRDNLEGMALARNYNRFLVDKVLAVSRPGQRVVDFGAGAGTFSRPVAEAQRQVVCVETDPTLCQALAQGGQAVVQNIEMLDDASVDCIYSLNVLEHITEDEAVLKAWSRKLKPGGTVFVYVPAFQVLYTSMDRKVGHVRRYTRGELQRKLQRAGLDVKQSRYADSIGFAATLVYKLTDRGQGDINPGMLKLYDRAVFPLSALLDAVLGRLLGKNTYAVAVKP